MKGKLVSKYKIRINVYQRLLKEILDDNIHATMAEHFFFRLKSLFSIEIRHRNPQLPGLTDHNFPVFNHDRTDHITKPK